MDKKHLRFRLIMLVCWLTVCSFTPVHSIFNLSDKNRSAEEFSEGQMVFVDEDGDLYLYRFDSDEKIRLTEDAEWYRYGYPKLSEDGKKLAFLRNDLDRGEQIYDLFIMDLSDRSSKLLAKNVDNFDWHPEGGLIAYGFSTSENCVSPDQTSTNGIMLVDINSGETSQLITPSKENIPLAYPGYSYNGEWLSMQSYLCFSSGYSNNTYHIPSKQSYNLGFGSMDWSPIGNKLVWIEDVWSGGDGGVLLMSPDKTDERKIFQDPNLSASRPAWSPSGEMIALQLDTRVEDFYFDQNDYPNWENKLIVIDANGNILFNVCEGNRINYCLFKSWSPSSKLVLFTKGDFEDTDWYVFSIETKEIREINEFVPGEIGLYGNNEEIHWGNAYLDIPVRLESPQANSNYDEVQDVSQQSKQDNQYNPNIFFMIGIAFAFLSLFAVSFLIILMWQNKNKKN